VSWLPQTFRHPQRAEIDAHHHLRPIAAADVDLDMAAVMGSRDRLFSIYGQSWGWPPATMSREQDLEDIVHHVDEMETNESFNYAVFDADETRLLGCLYIDQPDDDAHDAVVSWWLVDDLIGSELEATIDAFVPAWLREHWPFTNIRFGVWSGE
jgi:RimJ/RimL family protein N-acetyltransferase